MTIETLEFRPVGAEFKAGARDGEYEGYFSVFDNIDDGLDIIRPGAFSKTIQERGKRIKVLHGHDWSKLVGPAPDILQEDSKGLYARGRLTLGSFWGRETWELVKDGALNEGSIGYMTVPGKTNWMDSGIREIFEVKLYEISFVPLGMNPLTEVQAAKALLAGRPDATRLLQALLAELKAGARHSAKDNELLKTICAAHKELGCPDCAAAESDEEPQKALLDRHRTLRLRAAGLALAQRHSHS